MTEKYKFMLDWKFSDTATPPEDTVRTHKQPYHLRVPFLPKGSFGHLMRDNYEPIIAGELRLGVQPEAFAWVMVPNAMMLGTKQEQEITGNYKIALHYRDWFMGKDVKHWADVFPPAGSGAHVLPLRGAPAFAHLPGSWRS